MPARRRTAKSCSRNCTGMSRRRASSPIGTGPAPPMRASSVSARTAYGDLVVIDSTAIHPASIPGRMRDAAARYGPPLVLMAVIFALSAQPSLNSGLGTWDLVLRKLAHMTEYGLLSLLWWRALGREHRLAAIAITLADAATDEYHQTFVAGRH